MSTTIKGIAMGIGLVLSINANAQIEEMRIAIKELLTNTRAEVMNQGLWFGFGNMQKYVEEDLETAQTPKQLAAAFATFTLYKDKEKAASWDRMQFQWRQDIAKVEDLKTLAELIIDYDEWQYNESYTDAFLGKRNAWKAAVRAATKKDKSTIGTRFINDLKLGELDQLMPYMPSNQAVSILNKQHKTNLTKAAARQSISNDFQKIVAELEAKNIDPSSIRYKTEQVGDKNDNYTPIDLTVSFKAGGKKGTIKVNLVYYFTINKWFIKEIVNADKVF